MTMKMKRDKGGKKPNMVDLTGHWFVSFAGEFNGTKLEGSRILTINGEFDADNLLNTLTDNIQNSLPDSIRELIEKTDDRLVIRSFNRIDPPFTLGKLQ